MTECDISLGPVSLNQTVLEECNNETGVPFVEPLIITGDTTANNIHLVNADATIQLSDVYVNTQLPFTIVNSSVTLVCDGSSTIVSAGPPTAPGLRAILDRRSRSPRFQTTHRCQ
jgi:hypothetical protein